MLQEPIGKLVSDIAAVGPEIDGDSIIDDQVDATEDIELEENKMVFYTIID